jgi:hypothetical protein
MKKVMDWVRAEFAKNVVEIPRASNGGPRVDFYTGGRREPWCAHFVATAFRECGYPLPGDVKPSPKTMNPIALVAEMERQAKKAGIWFAPNDPKKHPLLPGDIMFLNARGLSDAGPGRHVAIVNFVRDNWVYTFDGNYGQKLASEKRFVGSSAITGYARMIVDDVPVVA